MVSAGINYQTPEFYTRRNRVTAGDLFVAVAIGVVVMALAVGLIGRFGLEFSVALAISGGAFVAMMSGHIALRRAEAPVRNDWAAAEHQPAL